MVLAAPHRNQGVEEGAVQTRDDQTVRWTDSEPASHKGDVDLERRLAEWERFYNFDRPHGAFAWQTPYEALRERLQ